MKKVQKFLSIFAIVIIILSSVMIIKNIDNYNYAKQCFEETITFSRIALEENQYGEVQQETKNEKYYDEVFGVIERETNYLNWLFKEVGLKGVIYEYIGDTYELRFDVAASSIDYNLARILLMSIFIAIMIFFAMEAKYKNIGKFRQRQTFAFNKNRQRRC